MAPAISADSLSVTRGSTAVLRNLSFSVEPGTVTGLLGPSGSGKTTLIRSIVGVQRITSGTVTVLGAPAGARLLRARVRYVTQSPSVYSDLTILENLRYFAKIYSCGDTDIRQALAEVHLDDIARRRVADLSGGQRARVSLAAAAIGKPDVLVLDEPTVGLDPLLREDLWSTFHRKAAEGTTVLVSSHVMDEADRCDRLLFIRQGALIADGTPGDLRAATGHHDLERAFIELVNHPKAAS